MKSTLLQFKSLWFEILQTGMNETLPPSEARKIRMLNAISFAGSLIIAAYLPLVLVFNVSSVIIVNILGCVICLVPIYLNQIYQYSIARLFFCIAMTLYFTFISIIFGSEVGIENILYVSFILPLIFFRNIRIIFGLLLLSVLAFIIARTSFHFVEPVFVHEILKYFFYFNAFFTFVLLFITVNSFKNEHESYEKEIEHKNANITDSLKYAQRIQNAILGSKEELVCNFKEGFVFLQPKDIVSGDFFWYSQVFLHLPHRAAYRVLIAADCTGHGVPGAFMTVMGNSLLDEIVNERNIVQPDEILKELDKKVIATLQKQNTSQNDGMDMVVLVVEERSDFTKYIHTAGAKNPIYYVRDGKIHEIKGSKFPIGSSQFKTNKIFEKHTVEYQENDIFYLFSDGFQDQFGGKENKKYMTKHFRAFLLSISHLPMKEQEEKISAELQNWKGNGEQTDDVLVIGVKV